MQFPKLVPAGTSYVKIPVSKRAAMRVILETVQRGSRYWCAGRVHPEKALGFAEKMAKLYHADANAAQRAYAKRMGRANTTVLMFPGNAESILWWLLVTPGTGLVHEREKLMDAHDKRSRLTWLDQYELVHEQRSRTEGGGRHWTWRLTAPRFAQLDAAMRELAASHGGHDRRDDLDALVQSLMRMPGYHGVRAQVQALLNIGRETWARTHRKADVYPWPEHVPYLDKGFACYHAPEPLRLDVLVRLLDAKTQHRLSPQREHVAAPIFAES